VMRRGDIDVSGKKNSGSLGARLVVAPCPSCEKLLSTSSSMVQSPGALKWGNRPVGLAVLPRENSGTEYHAWIWQRGSSHWSNRNNSVM
jgi:hypothetical protein